MIFSDQDIFSNHQAITASAASTNLLDLGDTGRVIGETADLVFDAGKGHKPLIRIQVTETFLTLTSLKVALQADNDVAFGSATTVLETEAIAVAALLAGYVFNIDAMPLLTNERYIRLYYTVAGSNATAGKIYAGINLGNQTA